MALPSLDFDAELVLCRCCSREAGAKRRSGSAGIHHRVGCGGKAVLWTLMASLQKDQQQKHQKEWKWTRGVDQTEMRKEEKRLRCALLNGSAWS